MSRHSRKASVQFEVYKAKVELEVIKNLGPGEMTDNVRKAWRLVKGGEKYVHESWLAKRSPGVVADEIMGKPMRSSSHKRSTTKRSKAKRSHAKRRTARRLHRLRRVTKRRGWGVMRAKHVPKPLVGTCSYGPCRSKVPFSINGKLQAHSIRNNRANGMCPGSGMFPVNDR